MAKGIRETGEGGRFGEERRGFGERGERFEGRGGFLGFLRSLDFLHIFFPPEPFGFFPQQPLFPRFDPFRNRELELLEAERFRSPFFGGFPGFFPGPFFGGFPDFDDFRFRRFGGFDRDDFRRFGRFGGFRGLGDGFRGGFRGGGRDFGGMHGGIHPGGGGHGGAHAFAPTVRGRDMPMDRRGEGSRGGQGQRGGDEGGRRGGQSRLENFGRRGHGGRGGERGEFGEGRFGRFGDFDGRFRGFEGFPFGFEGGRGTEELLQMCLTNPFFAQQPICRQLLAGGIGGFPGGFDLDEFGRRRGGEGFRGGLEGGRGFEGGRRAFVAQAGGALPARMAMGGVMPAMGSMMMTGAHGTGMGSGGRMAGARPVIGSEIGQGSQHPAGPIGHGVGGVPMRGMPGGIEGPGLHPGGMRGGEMGEMRRGFEGDGMHIGDDDFRRFHERGDFDDFGRHGHFEFDLDDFGFRRNIFIPDADDFFPGVEPDILLLEERCLTDVVFAETHPTLCLPLLERGGVRSIVGQPVLALATNAAGGAGQHVGGGMMGGGGFHPADMGQGGIGHQSDGGGFRSGGEGGERGGIGHPDFDFVRFHPERFRVFGERIFDNDLGDFLPFGFYEYQLVLAQNPYLICAYFPQLCQPRIPFLAPRPLGFGGQPFEANRPAVRRPQQRMAMPGQPAMGGIGGTPGQPGQPGQPGLRVATSGFNDMPVMNQLATTTTGAVLPILPDIPDLSGQDPAILMQTAQFAGEEEMVRDEILDELGNEFGSEFIEDRSFTATAGTESFADTDAFSNIPADRRGSINSPMEGRHNISMANYQ